MEALMEKHYQEQFLLRGFQPDPDNQDYCELGSTWRLSDRIGEGTFWRYGQRDLFDITIHNFSFHKDTLLEFNWPECMSISQYESVSGEELSPYRRLEAGYIKSFIGNYENYKILMHKNIPCKSITIEITPAYYEGYLKEQYPGEYTNPYDGFAAVGQTNDFPEMNGLLRMVKDYRGKGISAKLFYEAKVAEAISLVFEWGKNRKQKQTVLRKLSPQDLKALENITLYLNDHCLQEVSIEQLTKISCMGTRKLQTIFKAYHRCTITEYIQQRRMSQAEMLITYTDLSLGQIAQSVGYSSASRFAELFRKSTGILPGEFRKIAQKNNAK